MDLKIYVYVFIFSKYFPHVSLFMWHDVILVEIPFFSKLFIEALHFTILISVNEPMVACLKTKFI